jgi:N-acetylmuramoyl-L-alanine amidase
MLSVSRSAGILTTIIIVGFFLLTSEVYAGPAEKRTGSWFIGADGLVVGVFGKKPRSLWGPGLPGEVNFKGSFVPGFLSAAQWSALAASCPDCDGCRVPVRGPGAIQDRLVVVIDPGHGGSQRGAVGVTGVKEKDIVLRVARRVRRMLGNAEDVDVVMTRLEDDEITLEERVEMANLVQADLFVSIHANSFSSPALGGVETFFHSIEASGEEASRVASCENATRGKKGRGAADALSLILQDMQSAEKLRDSSRLAHLVQEQLAGAVPFENRGVMQADFTVLRGTRMPSILVELGFLSNPKEEQTLGDALIQEKIANAIREGVLLYWELAKRKQVSVPPKAGAR